jgi:ribose 5-phosphate isomerase B
MTQALAPVALTIALGADHAGYELKALLADTLRAAGHTVRDFGTNGPDRVDYPDHAGPVCRAVLAGEATYGILVCGTGNGMAMAANRFAGIRCGYTYDITSTRLTRAHNNANVIALGARLIGPEVALDILNTFLATPYEGGRHDQRIAKLSAGA